MFINSLIRFLNKQACLVCAQDNDVIICNRCQQFLPSLPQICPQGAQNLPLGSQCSLCSPKVSYDRFFTLYPYEFPIIQFIQRLKFHKQLIYSAFFASFMLKAIGESWYKTHKLPDAIIPIPLHPSRLKERGFNQAVEIARPIARKLKLPMLINSVQRIRSTQPQSLLSADDRLHNVAGAFRADHNFAGMHLAIVDDVVTTGSTIEAFCKELKQHAAQQIDIWCCARAQPVHIKVAQNPKTR